MASDRLFDIGHVDKAAFSDNEILNYLTAAQCGDVDTVQEFLLRGMPVDTLCLMFNETALTKACRMGEVDMVRLLCDRGADINSSTGTYSETALYIAVKNGKSDVVQFLLMHGADPNRSTSGHRTPLMLAASTGNPDLMRQLIDVGCKLDAVDYSGKSAMHQCFFHYQGHFFPSSVTLECVKILVEAGADMNIVSLDCWTALNLSIGRRLRQLTKYLLLQNCDPGRAGMAQQDEDAPRELGRRAPLCLAMLGKDVTVVKMLLLAGSSSCGCSDIKKNLFNEMSDANDVIWGLVCQPRSLKENCRIAIRDRLRECSKLGGNRFVQRVESLYIPRVLKGFVLLEELEDM